ncbi:MAG TPA: PH domain-containing protein [Nitrospiraceae bacterium]|nr:PH domain-containing protein [Nitrospiraceae bacterium]
MTTTLQGNEKILWQAYASWNQFAWLYLISLITALRGAILKMFGVPGWEAWFIGAVALVVCSIVLRYWVRYAITSRRVVITNVFTGQEIQAIALEDIGDISVQQRLIARFLGIGTLVLRSVRGGQVMLLRGIQEPETAQSQLQAVRLGERLLRPEQAG